MQDSIVKSYPISNQEYLELDKKFGKLIYFSIWKLKEKNKSGNDIDDEVQELRFALMRAASYYKRQTYIQSCFESLGNDIKDDFLKLVLLSLQSLWKDRKRHGAGRQKFGEHQEILLEKMIEKIISLEDKPDRNRVLKIDASFCIYCKSIVWNAQKNIGKKMTKEKIWRNNLDEIECLL